MPRLLDQGGFDGTFADTATFFGGLVKLVGEPQNNVVEAVRAEHCDVLDGFGASRSELVAGNYSVAFTPQKEYMFVSDPSFAEPMSCGVEWESNRPPIPGGRRLPLDIRELTDPKAAVRRIRTCFAKMGWPEAAVTETSFAAQQLAAVELTSTRQYTVNVPTIPRRTCIILLVLSSSAVYLCNSFVLPADSRTTAGLQGSHVRAIQRSAPVDGLRRHGPLRF